jgi:hypothetical protein
MEWMIFNNTARPLCAEPADLRQLLFTRATEVNSAGIPNCVCSNPPLIF